MNTQTIVLELERRAKAAGLSIAEVCRRAGIYQSTWTRWKSGKSPANLGPLGRCESVIAAEESSREAA